jgi:hypothetical protein
VVDALRTAPTGQVRFDDYKSYFEGSWYPVR